MCLCGKGLGRTQKEVEEMVCEESSVNEPAKDEVGLAASFTAFYDRETVFRFVNHGQTCEPEEERRCVCRKVWVLLF